jgi:hypothetical protein
MPFSDKPREPCPFCADCNKAFEGVEGLSHFHVGAAFRCPEDANHLAEIVRGKTGAAWLKARRLLRLYEHQYSLSTLLRKVAPCCFPDAGRYLIFRFLILLVTLCWMATSEALTLRWSASLIAFLAILDIMATHLAIAFVTRFPADALRSVIFAMFSFLQLAMAFAIFFAAIESSFTIGDSRQLRIGAFDSFYFSWLIMTTVGWAELAPVREAAVLKAIICAQLMASLSFLVMIVQIMVGWSAAHPGRAPRGLNEIVNENLHEGGATGPSEPAPTRPLASQRPSG